MIRNVIFILSEMEIHWKTLKQMEKIYLHTKEKKPLCERKLIFSTDLPTEHFWHQTCGFSTTSKFSRSWWSCTDCPELISSDSNYPELVHTPQVKGSFPQDCLTTPTHFRHQSWVPPGYHLYFWPTSHKSESSSSIICRRAHRIQENSPFTRLLVCDKRIQFRDTDERKA